MNLSGFDISGATLSATDLRAANLLGTVFNGATLTGAKLWETQRGGWSIQNVVCESAYWDKDGKELTHYAPGEFERLYSEKTKIALHYEGGIDPLEITTLPALIQKIGNRNTKDVYYVLSQSKTPLAGNGDDCSR